MKRLRAWVRAFFGFSRAQTNAFLVLLPFMAVIIFIEPVYQHWFTHQKQDFSQEEKKLDSILATMKWDTGDPAKMQPRISASFAFNPNTISADSLQLLGLSPAIAKRIQHYRLKGGKFFSIQDLKKIYGMDSGWVKQIEPYVILPSRETKKYEASPIIPKKEISLIDINQADTVQLKAIYGIGSKLSTRIIAYRNKLGGFVSILQLREVYGLDSLVIQEIEKRFYVDQNFQPSQINLNLADEKQLAGHPYIKSKLARIIVAYRQQHGNFEQLEELKRVSILSDETFEKIKPYLSVNP
jgi:competence protein ComEA